MQQKWVIFFLLFILKLSVFSQEKYLEKTVENLSGSVSSFLQDKRNPTLSVVSLKNATNLSDNAVQKIYQLIVFRIESNPKIKFKDSMLSFVDGIGKFKINRNRGLRYLMSLNIIRNKSKIGIGLTLYSVNLDKMVFTKYLEWDAIQGEIKFLNIQENKFNDFGFEKIIEIGSKKGLLDMKTRINEKGDLLYHFYYYDRIQIFKKENNVLQKKNVIELVLDKGYSPAIEPEGKLFFFNHDGNKFMVLGNNYSSKSSVFSLTDNVWKLYSKIDFIPFEIFKRNGERYFIGGKYEYGKNYFKNKLILKSINGVINNSNDEYFKSIKKFYSISFLKEGDKINSMYTIDTNYNFINYGSNFEVLGDDKGGNGFALSNLDNKWIIKTAFSTGKDKLRFFKINEIEANPKYEKNVEGEILFVNEGKWNDNVGVWIYLKTKIHSYFNYKLQFWSKKNGL